MYSIFPNEQNGTVSLPKCPYPTMLPREGKKKKKEMKQVKYSNVGKQQVFVRKTYMMISQCENVCVQSTELLILTEGGEPLVTIIFINSLGPKKPKGEMIIVDSISSPLKSKINCGTLPNKADRQLTG